MNTFDWKEKYNSQILSAREAIKKVRPGDSIFIGTGCGQPQHLVDSLVRHGDHIYDAHIIHLLTMGAAPYANPKFREKFKMNSFFIAENVRGAFEEGVGRLYADFSVGYSASVRKRTDFTGCGPDFRNAAGR